MLGYIFGDLYDALQYLPLGVLTAIAVILILYTYTSMRKKKVSGHKMIYLFLFIIYVIATIQISYFSREPGSRNSIDLILFSTWGDAPMSKAFVVENVIMFLPLGILVPAIWDNMRKLRKCFLLSLSCTIAIETMQLVTKRGYCQIDDVVMNTIGGILGYGIFFLVHRIIYRIKNGKK